MLPSTVIYSSSLPCLAAVIPSFPHCTTLKTCRCYNTFTFNQLHTLGTNRHRRNTSNSIVFMVLRTLAKTMAGCTPMFFSQRPSRAVELELVNSLPLCTLCLCGRSLFHFWLTAELT